MWRKLLDFRAEKKAQNPVTSLAVMVFSVPINSFSNDFWPCDSRHLSLQNKGGTKGFCFELRIVLRTMLRNLPEISLAIPPFNCWGSNNRNFQKKLHLLVFPLSWESLHHLLHQNILRELICVTNVTLVTPENSCGIICVILEGPMVFCGSEKISPNFQQDFPEKKTKRSSPSSFCRVGGCGAELQK